MAGKWDCVKCGHDTEGEGGNPWLDSPGGRICKTCSESLARRFYTMLGLTGPLHDEYGPDIQWHEVDAVLSRSSYIIPSLPKFPFLPPIDVAVCEPEERVAVRYWTSSDQQHGIGSEEEIHAELERALDAEGFHLAQMDKQHDASIRATAYYGFGVRVKVAA